jgi:hypothetical protein
MNLKNNGAQVRKIAKKACGKCIVGVHHLGDRRRMDLKELDKRV